LGLAAWRQTSAIDSPLRRRSWGSADRGRAAAGHHIGPGAESDADPAGGVGHVQRPGDDGRARGYRGWRLPLVGWARAVEKVGASWTASPWSPGAGIFPALSGVSPGGSLRRPMGPERARPFLGDPARHGAAPPAARPGVAPHETHPFASAPHSLPDFPRAGCNQMYPAGGPFQPTPVSV